MTFVIRDRVRSTTVTTGTGVITVSGTAPTRYRAFSAVCAVNDRLPYLIVHQSAAEWETGIATYSAANQLTRSVVHASSNANVVVNFSAGTKDVILTHTATEILRQSQLNVLDYGAPNNATGNAATAINAAIADLPVTGGDIFFPVGQYNLGTSINAGNGSSSAVSTRYGINLIGESCGAMFSTIAGMPTTPGVRFFWNGAANGVMLNINGPLQGWGAKNIFFDGNSGLAGGCIGVFAGQHGDSRNITVWGGSVYGIGTFSYSPFTGTGFPSAIHNRFVNVNVIVPNVAAARGIYLTANATGTGAGSTIDNSDFNEFHNIFMGLSGGVNTIYGVHLRGCDTNSFHMLHIAGGGPANGTGLLLDYTQNAFFPNGNIFWGVDNGATIPWAVSGTPDPGAHANYIYGVSTGNMASTNAMPSLKYVNYSSFIYEKITPTQVTFLQTPSANVAGCRAYVTNANATTFNSIVAGGGANTVPVFCDGTNWRIG